MKKGLYLVAMLSLTLMWTGCKKSEPAPPKAPQSSTQAAAPATDAAAPAVTLVTLKVPNMA